MANPLVPTAFDVAMTIMSLLVTAVVVVGVVVLVRRSGRRADARPTPPRTPQP